MDDQLPIIEVNEDNFEKLYPAIQSAIKGASFVAVDCELTGLGNREKLNFREVDLRYQYMVEIAQSYAIVSLGLSCFTCKSVSDVGVADDKGGEERIRTHDYLVQTFNVLTLCSDDTMVECNAHKFLLRHGFDFNKLYSKGLLYNRGCDKENEKWPNVRQLFATIIEHRKPLVIHNGLVDLVFLYQSFYADLPKKADTFAADLFDMFPYGVYDTKYIADYHQSMPASYLEYLYKKIQLKNARRNSMGQWHVRVRFPPYPRAMESLDWCQYLQIHSYSVSEDEDKKEVCETFAYHGWCRHAEKCDKSHNINKIVKLLQPKAAKKRGKSKFSGTRSGSLVHIIRQVAKKQENLDMEEEPRVLKHEGQPANKKVRKSVVRDQEKMKTEDTSSSEVENGNANGIEDGNTSSQHHTDRSIQNASGHRAGYDAFMTGFIFAFHITGTETLKQNERFTPKNLGLTEEVNKVYLFGKTFPFLIRTGTYASMSSNHSVKICKVRKDEIT